MAHDYYKNKKQQQGPTVLETIVLGIFKALWFLIKLPFTRGKKGQSSKINKTELAARRQEIEKLLVSNNPIELKHAVMEADKLVDYVLISYGYPGETFADRLRAAERNMDRNTYQSIWEGHKVRNQLAHEHNANISKEEFKQAVNNLLKYIRNF